ncbi:hypothetical protein IPJ72_02795 [Candidatus Peregrinibacteria bacterium]|nr:MAG: hypothetical protein IPJ72_02795 [Candidatus Peregrinibacteria bacterium]
MFREIEMDLGTHHFCILVLDSFVQALKQYHIQSRQQLFEQFDEIFQLIQEVKPRYAILIDSFYKIIQQAKGKPVSSIIKHIEAIKKGYEKELVDLAKVSQSIDLTNRTVLIFDHSHSVQNALIALRKKGQHFSVLIAEQDLNKTADNISLFHQYSIPFKVVPAYMLSHLESSVDAAFFGAVTLQNQGQFVMDPGSKSIISEMKLEKKPIYVFLTTSKFSLWQAESSTSDIYVKAHKRCHHVMNEIEFDRIKFSHDRVPVDLVDHIVTEKGIFDADGVRAEYDRLKAIRDKERKAYTLFSQSHDD